MKKSILFYFVLITQFCLGQNNDLIKKEAMALFHGGKIKEALNTLEQINDKTTLENTDINTWKKHFKEILDYKFVEVPPGNDSIKIVVVRTSLFAHFGVYNANTKKYLIAPIYDDIPSKNQIPNCFIVNLNHQNGVIDSSGKMIIPLGNYDINVNTYDKYIVVISNDGTSTKDFYNLDGKLVGHNIGFFGKVKQNYVITQNDLNKFQLFNGNTGQFVLEDCDKIENIDYYGDQNTQEVFIKKDNKYAVYNFVTNNFNAENDFDKVIVFNKNINVFSNYQNESEKNKFIIVKKNSKFGVFNLTQNKYEAEPVYDSITNFGNCLKNKVWRNLKYEYPIKEDRDYLSEAVIYVKNNLLGLKSTVNKTITEAEYDEIELIERGLYLIKKQKLWGWVHIEKDKFSIVKPQFDYVRLGYDEKIERIYRSFDGLEYDKKYTPYFETCFKNKTKRFTVEGKELPKSLSGNEKGYSKKETVNTISSNRRLTTRKRLENRDEGFFEDEVLYGLDDIEGNEIVKPIYKKIEPVSNSKNYFVIYNSGEGYDKVGVIDENGKIIIPTNYSSIDSFDNHCYLVQEGYFFGLIDKDGKEVVPIDNKEIKVFLDGLYIVKDKDNLFKIIDAQNKTIYVFPKFCDTVYKYDKIVSNKGEVFYNVHFGLIDNYLNWSENFLIRNDWSSRILEKYQIKEIYNNKIVQLETNRNNLYKKSLIGFYDLDTQKLIKPQFEEIEHDYVRKLIYCKTVKTNKYFDIIIDENLNTTTSNDHITNTYNNVIFYEKDGKYGFFDKNHQKTKNTFQSISLEFPISSSNQKLYQYFDNKEQKKGGYIDENGKIIIKANLYDQIYSVPISNELVLLTQKFKKEELEQILVGINKTADKIDFLTLYGNKIASLAVSKKHYSVTYIYKNGMAFLKAPDETLFFDLKENKIISRTSSISANQDKDGGFTILKNDTSILDSKKILAQKYNIYGNLISERIIERNQNSGDLENWNYTLVQKKENKYGVVGVNEKKFVSFVYDTLIPSPVNTVYIAKKNNKFGLIDSDNNVLLNFEYDTINLQYLSEYVNRDEKYKGIDYCYKKDKRLPPQTSFNFIVSKDHKNGILSSNLKFILPVEYDGFNKERNLFGNITTRKGKRSMIYNSKGDFLFQAECDSIKDCQNHYKIYKNNKQGILNQKGIEVFPMLYPKVEKTALENLFLLEKDSKKYIANSKGEIISKAYDEIKSYEIYNYLKVKVNNKFGLMNNKGTIVVPELYDNIVQIPGDFYVILSLNGKEGIIDMNSNKNEILPIKIPVSYPKIKGIVGKKYVIVSNNTKEGVIDLNNKILIPMIYDSINYQEPGKYFICTKDGLINNITPDNVIIKIDRD